MKYIISTLLFLTISFKCYSSNILIWKEDHDSIIIDRYSLQKIFTKRITRWPSGRPIRVFIKPMNSFEHKHFVYNILGMSPFFYQQSLYAQVYAGKSSSVIEIPYDNLMIMKIEQTPGAIGYINYEIYIGNKRVTVVDGTTVR